MLFDVQTATVPESGTIQPVGFAFDWDSRAYRMTGGSPTEVSGSRAVRAWLQQLIRTRPDMALYPSDYGCAALDLIGKKVQPGYVLSEIRRSITDSAAYCPLIQAVTGVSMAGDSICIDLTLADHTTTQEVIPIEP